jgi:hypothetical protein
MDIARRHRRQVKHMPEPRAGGGELIPLSTGEMRQTTGGGLLILQPILFLHRSRAKTQVCSDYDCSDGCCTT